MEVRAAGRRGAGAPPAYYVYLPWQPQYIAHQPVVKGFRHHDGYGLGYRLMYTWLER